MVSEAKDDKNQQKHENKRRMKRGEGWCACSWGPDDVWRDNLGLTPYFQVKGNLREVRTKKLPYTESDQ